MFSKEEAKKVREEFWNNFGKKYQRKWLLYDTKIKEIQLKFTFNSEVAQVSLAIVSGDDVIRAYYYEKMCSLKNILLTEYLPEAIYEEHYQLPEGKEISRIYTELQGVSVYRKSDWPGVEEFLSNQMQLLESFFLEYKDTIDS